jgi:hypothetical protein
MQVIVYLPEYQNGPSSPAGRATSAFSEGLTKLGIEHSVRKTNEFKGEIVDIAIVNGWTKKMLGGIPGLPKEGRVNRNTVIAAQKAAGKPAWCIERGFLGNRDDWSSLSVGGFAWSGNFRAEGMPSDRWDAMGIELKPWRTGGNYILLCAQVPWDAQVDDGNHIEWLEKTVREIRSHTDRSIKFRPHPKAYRRGDPYGGLSAEFREMADCGNLSKVPHTTFEYDLEDAHAVVCFNSNVAILATVAGVTVFTGAPCLADPIAVRLDGSDLSVLFGHIGDFPMQAGREQWAHDLAYKQWHIDDFKVGTPWLHLTR